MDAMHDHTYGDESDNASEKSNSSAATIVEPIQAHQEMMSSDEHGGSIELSEIYADETNSLDGETENEEEEDDASEDDEEDGVFYWHPVADASNFPYTPYSDDSDYEEYIQDRRTLYDGDEQAQNAARMQQKITADRVLWKLYNEFLFPRRLPDTPEIRQHSRDLQAKLDREDRVFYAGWKAATEHDEEVNLGTSTESEGLKEPEKDSDPDDLIFCNGWKSKKEYHLRKWRHVRPPGLIGLTIVEDAE